MIYQDILLTLSKLFNLYKIDYFVTGSLAVNYYGRERMSHDFDFKLAVSKDNIANLLTALSKLLPDYSYDKEDIISSIKDKTIANILYLPLGLKIDLWFNNKTSFDTSRFKRKIAQKINSNVVNFISPEDLILIKLDWYKKSSSDRHLEDAAAVFQRQKNLDQKYISTWAKKLKILKYLKTLQNYPIQEW